MTATLALPLLALALFVMIELAIDRASRRMFDRDPQGLYVASRFGHRAAMDVLSLAAAWLFVKPGLEIPEAIPLGGIELPMEHLAIVGGALLLVISYRLRLALRWA